MREIVSKSLIDRARLASKLSGYPKYHIGAVVFNKGKIYATGTNSYKGSSLQLGYNKLYKHCPDGWVGGCTHAEVDALKDLIKTYRNTSLDFSRLSILVYREGKDGRYALAKPCPACEHALRDLGIKDVYYTGNDSIVHERYN